MLVQLNVVWFIFGTVEPSQVLLTVSPYIVHTFTIFIQQPIVSSDLVKIWFRSLMSCDVTTAAGSMVVRLTVQ